MSWLIFTTFLAKICMSHSGQSYPVYSQSRHPIGQKVATSLISHVLLPNPRAASSASPQNRKIKHIYGSTRPPSSFVILCMLPPLGPAGRPPRYTTGWLPATPGRYRPSTHTQGTLPVTHPFMPWLFLLCNFKIIQYLFLYRIY